MDFADAFAGLATAFPGVWIAAQAQWPGEPIKDDGGSIITPGTPASIPCTVQFDAVTDRMRTDADFKEKDVRLLVLSSGLAQAIDSEAKIIVATGPNAGTWSLRSVDRDPAGIGWECRGRAWR